MNQTPFIVNHRSFLKILALVCIFFAATSFRIPPTWQEKLARLPYVGKYFKAPAPPLELREKTAKTLEEAYWEGAPFYQPEIWEKAQTYFKKGEEALAAQNFSHARYYFEKALKLAREAQEKTIKQKSELKRASEQRFARLIKRWQEADIPPQERLSWEIRLHYLKELLDKGRFKEFNEEAEAFEEELIKLTKREGPKGGAPSQPSKN